MGHGVFKHLDVLCAYVMQQKQQLRLYEANED